MSDSQQDRPSTPEEDIKALYGRVAKLNDMASALLAPEWGSEMGIIPTDHPLYVGEKPAAGGIRGLLEHVGIDTSGRDITVDGRVVDPALTEPVTVTDPDYLRQQLHAAIESEIYEYRERTMFWEETSGVTQEIAQLATRGAMEVCDRHVAQLRQRLELADEMHPDDVASFWFDQHRRARQSSSDQRRRAKTAEERADRLAATLDEVLRHFVHKGHPGEPCLQTGWISEKTVARWRAALYPPQPAAHDDGPSVTECAEADRHWPPEGE